MNEAIEVLGFMFTVLGGIILILGGVAAALYIGLKIVKWFENLN